MDKRNLAKEYFDRYLAKMTGKTFKQVNVINTSADVVNEPRPLSKLF